MRKRLRKKQGKGEFADYSFGVWYVLDDLESGRANSFLDRFVEEVIVPAGLECYEARSDRGWDFRVACINGLRPTVAQRDALVAWLAAQRELARFKVEELGEPSAS